MPNRLMLIDCPNCAKSYRIGCAALGPHGRNVACPYCLKSWFVEPDKTASEIDETNREDAFTGQEITAEVISERTRQPGYEELYGTRTKPAAPVSVQSSVRHVPRAAIMACAILATATSVLAFRTAIVKLWPKANAIYTAAGLPVNARGLGLQNVRVKLLHDGAQPVLVVDGEIANLREGKAQVPELRLAVRDMQGHEIYSWDAASPKTKLDGGETIAFRARLAAPPGEGKDVFVRFAAADEKSAR